MLSSGLQWGPNPLPPQAALFALAVADVLLVNIWCHDIGREQGSGKPLMKTIFQVGGAVVPSCSRAWRC